MISSKLLCRISIHGSMSWVPSACPCAVSSPTYIAKGSCPRQEDQGAPIPQQGPRFPCLFCALTGQLVPSPLKEVRSSPRALQNSFVSDHSQESTLPSAYTASHKHLRLSPHVVENRGLDSGKRRPGQDSERAGPGPVPQEEGLHACYHKPQGKDRAQQVCK
ncbi:unnamed protein product [Pipistrellus nathusii]|uniref:Uncharacterized protein n=1 Tax=Pipistrellus nathusii TaxID=59473 RepID=A0ABP0AE87_PIPNA